jgi:hypothetical protein
VTRARWEEEWRAHLAELDEEDRVGLLAEAAELEADCRDEEGDRDGEEGYR